MDGYLYSRERNREHARKTRIRKKAHISRLQERVRELRAESESLKAEMGAASTARILLGLSTGQFSDIMQADSIGSSKTNCDNSKQTISDSGVDLKNLEDMTEDDFGTFEGQFNLDDLVADYGSRKRRRILSISDSDGESGDNVENVKLMRPPMINWKTGKYKDDDGVSKTLSKDELESLRRERNRVHAKMTRDRKKIFVAAIENAIEKLEYENQRMRRVLGSPVESANDMAPVTPDSGPCDG